ncbi:MAG: hypothetical protein Q7S40_29935 [Opitutaceae bacterium]|nr:hypothetical protein [Opitutaceae bacterium]
MRLLLPLLLLVVGARAASPDVALVGASVFPTPEAAPLRDAVIVVRDGRIAAVGPRRSVGVPAGVRVIDCAGKFITAGFWNCHVHIFTPDLLHAREKPAAQLEASLEAMFGRWGFTTVFDIASVLENTLALRDRIERGEIRGPRLLTTGEPIWTETPRCGCSAPRAARSSLAPMPAISNISIRPRNTGCSPAPAWIFRPSSPR